MFCGFCGVKNQDGSTYCMGCGSLMQNPNMQDGYNGMEQSYANGQIQENGGYNQVQQNYNYTQSNNPYNQNNAYEQAVNSKIKIWLNISIVIASISILSFFIGNGFTIGMLWAILGIYFAEKGKLEYPKRAKASKILNIIVLVFDALLIVGLLTGFFVVD